MFHHFLHICIHYYVLTIYILAVQIFSAGLYMFHDDDRLRSKCDVYIVINKKAGNYCNTSLCGDYTYRLLSDIKILYYKPT
jgi:hypothetical protein